MTQNVDCDRKEIIDFVCTAGNRYWKNKTGPTDFWIENSVSLSCLGQSWEYVTIPKEYHDLGVNGSLLVDSACIIRHEKRPLVGCDLYLAAFSYLAGFTEKRAQEKRASSHSYSFRLDVPNECFEYAWVNRILLLLRRLDAIHLNVEETLLFGPIPKAIVRLEHDVDALDKTIQIRLKQSLFELFNLASNVYNFDWSGAKVSIKKSFRMIFASPSYYHLDKTAEMAIKHGLTATYYIHARKRFRGPMSWLLDPSYFCSDKRLQNFVKKRLPQGFRFALHPSFYSFDDAKKLADEKKRLQNCLGLEVIGVRQHWLRFSPEKTWAAQKKAGLLIDATLGFNDRSGFRFAAALEYKVWGVDRETTDMVFSIPMILMDSHLYSYHPMKSKCRQAHILRLFDEVSKVGGVACVNWHPHSLADDYDWGDGFEELLLAFKDFEGLDDEKTHCG